MKNFIRKIKSTWSRKTYAIVAITLFAVVGTVLLFSSRAATPFASLEPENGSSSGAITPIQNDQTASGTKAVQFGSTSTTPPVSGEICTSRDASGGVPADKFPGSACTGVPPNTTLRSCARDITTNDAKFDGCLFSNGVYITGQRVEIKNSKIIGVVTSNYTIINLTMIDVEIDGQNQDSTIDATNGMFGYTCIRCHVHDVGKGFTGSNFTAIDSYVHDIYAAGTSHNENILGSGGNIRISRNNLVGNFSEASTGAGLSGTLIFYTHGDWGPLDNVLVENSRIESRDAWCIYGGNSPAQDPTRIRFIGNRFVKNPATGACGYHGLIIGWFRGNGNEWTNNYYTDGTFIPEPQTSDYN